MATFYLLNTEVAQQGVALAQPINFDVFGGGGSNISLVAVAVKYIDDTRRFMIYESDAFVTPFAPGSSISGIGTNNVTATVFEFGGWRQRIREIYVFGVQDDGDCFAQDILNLPPVSAVEGLGITVDGFDSGGGGSGQDLLLPLPTGTQVGDLLIANAQSGGGFPVIPGWTTIDSYFQSHFGGGTTIHACWKWADAADISAGQVVWDRGFATGSFAGSLGAYRNVNPIVPFESIHLVNDGGDPEVNCIIGGEPGCGTQAIFGGNPYTLWGPGFLPTPFSGSEAGSCFVYCLGGGSGGGGSPPAPTAPTSSFVAGGGSGPVSSFDDWNSIGQSSSIRTRTSGQGYYVAPVPGEGLRWEGGVNTSNRTAGISVILRPGVG